MAATTLETYRDRLHSRIPLIGAWLRRRAIHALQEDGSAEAVEILTEAVLHSPHVLLQAEGLPALWLLAQQQNVDAREALCRLAIEHPSLHLRDRVIKAGYVPKDESQRVLFYFLTEQWNKYEALDFEHRLLRAVYDTAGPRLRRQIAAKARAAGRLEWVEVVAGGKQGRRLGLMTENEWKASLSVLQANARWSDIWLLAQEAPPRWSAILLRRLEAARWKPQESQRADFERLLAAARNWPADDFEAHLQCTAILQGHNDEVRCLAISPNRHLLASGGGDKLIRLWDLSGKKDQKALAGHGTKVNCLAISPDGRILASGDNKGAVWLWRLPSGEPLAKLVGHSERVMCLAISPDSRTLASGSADSNICLWMLREGEHRRTLEDHSDGVLDLAITPDGDILASASVDCSVRLWSLPEGRNLRTLRGHRGEERDAVLCLAISADGKVLASGGTDDVICLWRLPSGDRLATLEEHLGDVNCLAISPHSDVLISGGGDNSLRFWQLPSGEELGVAEAHSGEVTRLAVSADGRLAASVSGFGLGHDHSIRLWSVESRRSLRTLYGHTRHITSLVMSRDGRYLASGSGDCTVRVWSSELQRLSRLPAAQATLADLEWAQKSAGGDTTSEAERAAWTLITELLRRKRRHDILIAEAQPRVIEIGEFDIEIEG
jgi:WD40 repeat protein